jgi:hypothetical protein
MEVGAKVVVAMATAEIGAVVTAVEVTVGVMRAGGEVEVAKVVAAMVTVTAAEGDVVEVKAVEIATGVTAEVAMEAGNMAVVKVAAATVAVTEAEGNAAVVRVKVEM